MTYGLLTPDVPLGPFEGSRVTVWSAQGKQAKLHAKPSCSYLRSARFTEREVRLDAATVGRLCPQCTAYGSWARPGTGLAIFLDAVTGLGLLYEMDRYHEADEDTYSDEEVGQAASILIRAAAGSEEGTPGNVEGEAEDDAEDESWEELQEARHVRETVFAEWLDALTSLTRVSQVLDHFPWLRSWARAGVQLKADHLEVLRAQAARLVAPDSLVLAAAVSVSEKPDLPSDDPAFALLGNPAEVAAQLTSLWRQWRSKVEDSWDHPREQQYLVHHLASGMSSRRKGYDLLMERAQELVSTWERAAQSTAADEREECVLVGRVPDTALAQHGSREPVIDRLSEWERAVLASYTVAVDWGQPAVTVRVPQPVATCLLSGQSALAYDAPAHQTPASVAVAEPTAGADESLRPGVFDDTPVNGRRLVTVEHLRALRSTMADAEQLYVVLGVGTGVEVVALSALEQRCGSGWQGVILAGARDLPDALFETGLLAMPEGASEGAGVWTPRVYDPHDEAFGRSLGAAEGERVLVRLCEGRRNAGQALKSLALARSVADLRDLEAAGYDDQGHPRSPFAPAVWDGLLAMEQLDLEPFGSGLDGDWPRGSGLPLGVLASVQAYTTDAAGRFQGRAHSPDCAHRRPQPGVRPPRRDRHH
ncbi:hypothetical protein [Streptomyces sp. NBC_00009]|uniref:hypothetical protein n=1 Tax=Streptomyces sp. NBC_00009 TaxID=2975620 RepID=UPI00324E2D41